MTARYQVEDVIGRGASGIVYRARQVDTGGRVVAYKRVATADPAGAERMRTEIAALAALDHPNVIRIFDVAAEAGAVAVVMQHAAGGSLADRLDRQTRLRPADVATVLIAVADALASAHARGILHRDIKPSNILFTADGHPLLSDFGAAALRTADAGEIPEETTPEYLDPAVAAGDPYDERSDIYAVGIVGIELLTGSRLLPGRTPDTVADVVDPAAGALVEVLRQATHPDPAQRLPGAAALADSLRRVIAARPVALPEHEARATSGNARLEPPTRPFGPRPPAPDPDAGERAIPWRRIAAVAALMIIGPSLVVASLRSTDAPAATPAAAAVATPQLRAAPQPCAGTTPAPPVGDVQQGDLLGKGCMSWVRHRAGVLEAALPGHSRPLRVRVGGRDDQVLLGDWDCNGSDTVAVYRPATGVIFEFSSWPSSGRMHSDAGTASGVADGVATLAANQACDSVVVRPAAGA